MKERRTLQQMYYDILTSIMAGNSSGKIKITHIQLGAKLSFDKIKLHLKTMTEYKLIDHNFVITKKGYNFYKEFTQLVTKVNDLQNTLQIPMNVPGPDNIGLDDDALRNILASVKVLENEIKLIQEKTKMQIAMK